MGKFLVIVICLLLGAAIVGFLVATEDNPKAITIVPNLPETCFPGKRVAVQDASETKAGAAGRVTLYQCKQEKPHWEVE